MLEHIYPFTYNVSNKHNHILCNQFEPYTVYALLKSLLTINRMPPLFVYLTF